MLLAPWNDPTVKWVCENHPDKEFEVECSCGAGMPEPTPENYQKGYITKDNMKKHTNIDNEITGGYYEKKTPIQDAIFLTLCTLFAILGACDLIFGAEQVTYWIANLVG